MGLITHSAPSTGIWLNARNGALAYRLEGDSEEHTASGYSGIITGIRTRSDSYDGGRPRIIIDVAMQDASDGTVPRCVISGTLIDPTDSITVFGKMLVSRLAHPDCMSRRGQEVEIAVWAAKTNERITCCTLRDPATKMSFGAHDTSTMQPEELRKAMDEWVGNIVEHFGTFGRESNVTATGNAKKETEAPFAQGRQDDGLPF